MIRGGVWARTWARPERTRPDGVVFSTEALNFVQRRMTMSMSTFGKPLLTAAAAAAALFGVSAATVTPAEAGASTGTWRAYPGGVYRGGYGGYGGGGYGRHAYGGGPR